MYDDKEILISIVIPVYNTPVKFFEKCIRSIISTTASSYEIIVIDDGSEAEKSRFYNEVCMKYDVIHYWRKDNGGVSSARNHGIRKAKGEYIAFVDADDVVAPGFLKDAVGLVKKYRSDLVMGAMQYENMPLEPQGTEKELYLSKDNIISLKKSFLGIPQSDLPYGVMGSPCAKLYKKSIVEKVMFSEQMTHLEDQLFNRKVFDLIDTAAIVPDCWYIYNQNDFSAMHNVEPGKYLNKLIPFFEEWEKANELENEDEIRIGARRRSILFFFIAVNDIVSDVSITFTDRIRKMNDLYAHKIFANLVKESPMKQNLTKDENFRLFLIKNKMLYIIYCLVYVRRRMRKLAGTL